MKIWVFLIGFLIFFLLFVNNDYAIEQITLAIINLSAPTNYIRFTEDSNSASQSIWNITFIGNQNKTFYIKIPKNANVTNADLNLSGFNATQKPLSFYDDFSTTDYISSLVNLTVGTKSSNCEGYAGKIIPVTLSYYNTFSDGIRYSRKWYR